MPAPEPEPAPQAVEEPAPQAVEEPAPQLRAPWEDTPEPEPFGEEEELSGWVDRARSWMPQTRKGALAMASAATCVVMSIVVLVWWFRDEPTGPEQAAAETPSAVVAQPVAAGAQPGDGAGASRFARAAARKRPRIVFAESTRRDRPKRRPQSPLPNRVPAVLKPLPSAARPPIATSRPAAPTTTMPASAAPGRTETSTTKPAATPPTTPPGPPPALRVSCVMQGPSGPAAIINGACVTIGDTLKGAKIIAIGQFAVEVEYTGHRYFIGVSAPGRSASTAAYEEETAEDEDEDDSDEE